MVTKEVYQNLEESTAIVSDIDNTLIGSRMAESGLSLVKHVWGQGRYWTAITGFFGGLKVLGGTALKKSRGKLYADNWGLQTYHRILSKHKITREEVDTVLRKYVEKHEMLGAKEFLDYLKNLENEKVLLLTTTGPSNGAEVCQEYFGADDYVANTVLYDGEFVSDIKLDMKTSDDRKRLTEEKLAKFGRRLEDSIVIGDSEPDWLLMRCAKVSIASPQADNGTIARADLHIRDFREFIPQVKTF
ncbi:MAG: haloacid dehalogenase-like hydrolase [Candidatus Aenigmatarchaeota archaeon]